MTAWALAILPQSSICALVWPQAKVPGSRLRGHGQAQVGCQGVEGSVDIAQVVPCSTASSATRRVAAHNRTGWADSPLPFTQVCRSACRNLPQKLFHVKWPVSAENARAKQGLIVVASAQSAVIHGVRAMYIWRQHVAGRRRG